MPHTFLQGVQCPLAYPVHGENDDNSGDPSTEDNLDWNYWAATGIIMRAGLEFAGNCHGWGKSLVELLSFVTQYWGQLDRGGQKDHGG